MGTTRELTFVRRHARRKVCGIILPHFVAFLYSLFFISRKKEGEQPQEIARFYYKTRRDLPTCVREMRETFFIFFLLQRRGVIILIIFIIFRYL